MNVQESRKAASDLLKKIRDRRQWSARKFFLTEQTVYFERLGIRMVLAEHSVILERELKGGSILKVVFKSDGAIQGFHGVPWGTTLTPLLPLKSLDLLTPLFAGEVVRGEFRGE